MTLTLTPYEEIEHNSNRDQSSGTSHYVYEGYGNIKNRKI